MAQGRGRGGRGSARRTSGARGSSGTSRAPQSRPRSQGGASGRAPEDGAEQHRGQRAPRQGAAPARGAGRRSTQARGGGARGASGRAKPSRPGSSRTGSSRAAPSGTASSARGASARASSARGAGRETGTGGPAARRGGGRAGGRAQRAGAPAPNTGAGSARTRQAAPGTARSSRATSTQAGRPSRSGRPGGGAPYSDRLRSAGARRPRVPRPRYGLRRTLVAGLAILLVVGLGAGAVAGAVWVRETIRTQDADRAAAQTRTVYPDPEACRSGDLSVESTGPEVISAGEGASFTLGVTNSGSVSCLLDAGAASIGVELASGEHRVWSSTACPVGAVERPLLLGQGDSTRITLEWNGYTVGSDCALAEAPAAGPTAQASGTAPDSASGAPSQEPGGQDSASPQPQEDPGAAQGGDERVAGPGTYRYRFTLAGQDLTEPAVLVIQ